MVSNKWSVLGCKDSAKRKYIFSTNAQDFSVPMGRKNLKSHIKKPSKRRNSENLSNM